MAAVQFHLVNTTILLLAREGLRRGCLTAGQQAGQSASSLPTRQVLATAALALPAGAVVAAGVLGVAGLWGGAAPSPAAASALRLQALAALLELASEPLYVLASLRLRFGVRVGSEAAATLLRGGLSLWLLGRAAEEGKGGGAGWRAPRWRKAPPPPPSSRLTPGLALSWGQVAYGAVILGVHLAAFAPDAAAGGWAARAA